MIDESQGPHLNWDCFYLFMIIIKIALWRRLKALQCACQATSGQPGLICWQIKNVLTLSCFFKKKKKYIYIYNILVVSRLCLLAALAAAL